MEKTDTAGLMSQGPDEKTGKSLFDCTKGWHNEMNEMNFLKIVLHLISRTVSNSVIL